MKMTSIILGCLLPAHTPTHTHRHVTIAGRTTNVSTYSKNNTIVSSIDKDTPHGRTSRDSKHSYCICGHLKHDIVHTCTKYMTLDPYLTPN